MSNYLENLIAKSFNKVDFARPRLASRFESLPQGAPLALGEMQSEEMSDAMLGRDREPYASQENSFALNRAELHRDLPVTPATELPEETTELSVWRGNQRTRQNAERQASRQQITTKDRFQIPPVVSQESEKPDPESDSPNLHVANLRQPRTPTVLQSDREFARQQTTANDHILPQQEEINFLKDNLRANRENVLPASLHNMPTPVRRPLNTESEEKESNITYLPVRQQANTINVQPRVALRMENQLSSDPLRPVFQQPVNQPTEAPVRPTINVTIGRIEVRATTPQAAPKRQQQSAAPTMSLEEYLRKRERGGAE